EERAELEPLERARFETHLAPDLDREIADPAGVRRRVLVVRLEGVRERLDGRDERVLERLEVARVRERELRLMGEPAEQPQLPLAEGAALGRNGGDDAPAAPAVERQRRDREARARVEDFSACEPVLPRVRNERLRRVEQLELRAGELLA